MAPELMHDPAKRVYMMLGYDFDSFMDHLNNEEVRSPAGGLVDRADVDGAWVVQYQSRPYAFRILKQARNQYPDIPPSSMLQALVYRY